MICHKSFFEVLVKSFRKRYSFDTMLIDHNHASAISVFLQEYNSPLIQTEKNILC